MASGYYDTMLHRPYSVRGNINFYDRISDLTPNTSIRCFAPEIEDLDYENFGLMMNLLRRRSYQNLNRLNHLLLFHERSDHSSDFLRCYQ